MEKISSCPAVLNDLVTVQEGSRISGYSRQYLRRLLRKRKIDGIKIGNLWLIKLSEVKKLLKKSNFELDQRFGPKSQINSLGV